MANAIYTVNFPDGKVVEFQGVEGMSDSDAFTRAIQERSIKEGKIQDTWLGGAAKQMGQEKTANAALMTGVALAAPAVLGAAGFGGAATGAVAAARPITALAPLAADWLRYATRAETGEQAEKPTLTNQAVDLGEGMAGAYGPAVVARAGDVAARTAGQITRMARPTAVLMKAGSDFISPAAQKLAAVTPDKVASTLREIVQLGKNTAQRMIEGVSADDLELMRASVKAGMNKQTAARIIGNGKTALMKSLMKLYNQPPAEFTWK